MVNNSIKRTLQAILRSFKAKNVTEKQRKTESCQCRILHDLAAKNRIVDHGTVLTERL